MQGWNAGSINILTNTAYTIGVAGRPTRVYSAYVYAAATMTNGALILMNNAAAGTEFVRLNCSAKVNSDTTNWIDFSPYGLLFPNTCYACPNSGTAYSTIVYEVLP
jgi:hypothetical protein